jgi:hypothetical protein
MTPDLPLTASHRRRLRLMWRSAGWPYQDLIEVELIATGLLERIRDGAGCDTLRVTDAGIRVIAATTQKHRVARSAHEELVSRVALEMHRSGRIVWRGLSLRAPPVGVTRQWPMVMPDVYSIRHTTVEDYVEPIAHEIKVSRADLRSDLRNEAKRESYRALSSQCWYVIKAGIAQPEEIPAVYGVMLASETALEVARPAPRQAMRLPLPVWMALARANAEQHIDSDCQGELGNDAESLHLQPSVPQWPPANGTTN